MLFPGEIINDRKRILKRMHSNAVSLCVGPKLLDFPFIVGEQETPTDFFFEI